MHLESRKCCMYFNTRNKNLLANQFWVNAGKNCVSQCMSWIIFQVILMHVSSQQLSVLRVRNQFICKYNLYARSLLKQSTTEQHTPSHFCFAHNYHSMLHASSSHTVVFGTSSKKPCQNSNIRIVKNHEFQIFWRTQIL